jgi:hypothetical protein
MDGPGLAAVIAFIGLMSAIAQIATEKPSLMEFVRLQAPLQFGAACLYLFARGTPHDPNLLFGCTLSVFLSYREVGRRVAARMKKQKNEA